jgi:hypothetical protein
MCHSGNQFNVVPWYLFFIDDIIFKGPFIACGAAFYSWTMSVPASTRGRYYDVVDVGDAEKRQPFLQPNALPAVKKAAHVQLSKGDGVIELIDRVCRDDAHLALAGMHGILLRMEGSQRLSLKAVESNILIAGKPIEEARARQHPLPAR